MTVWYVHRRADGSIASIHEEPQPGYAEEAVAATNQAVQAILASPVPVKANAGSFMRACARLGWYDGIVAFVNGIPGTQGKELQVLLLHAVEYRRHNPDLITVAHAIGMTDANIDEVFVLADQLDRTA